MVIIWIVLLTAVLYVIQAFLYNKYWKVGVYTNVCFKQSAIFEGEQGVLEEVVENAKTLPIVALKVKFQTSKNLRFLDLTNTVVTDNYYRNDIISVGPYRKLVRELAFVGLRRGYYIIDGMTLVGTDLFMRAQMVSENPCHTALYVFPKPYRHSSFALTLKKLNGEILAKRHLVEDPFEFRGIKDYEPYDDIRYIHWKSTAKTGELKVVQKNYTAVKNIRIFLYLNHSTMIQKEELLENSIRILLSLTENYLSLGSTIEIYGNCEDVISGQVFSMEKIQNLGYMENLYKALARLDISKLHSFEDTLEAKFMQDTNTATILVSPYGNADLQEKLLSYVAKNEELYWIYPKKKDDLTVINEKLAKHILPIIVEGTEA